MELIEGHYKAPLAQSIQKEYNKLIDIVSQIPSQQHMVKSIEGTRDTMSVADIIAYHIGWGKLLLGWYEAGCKKKIPQMPGEGFTKWDYTALARHFYTKYHYDGADEQIKTLHTIVKKIIAIVEHEYSTGNLNKIGVWDWCTLQSGKKWPLSKWIIVNTASPYKKSYTSIRKLKKKLLGEMYE